MFDAFPFVTQGETSPPPEPAAVFLDESWQECMKLLVDDYSPVIDGLNPAGNPYLVSP